MLTVAKKQHFFSPDFRAFSRIISRQENPLILYYGYGSKQTGAGNEITSDDQKDVPRRETVKTSTIGHCPYSTWYFVCGQPCQHKR
jgi:hypothetical protein